VTAAYRIKICDALTDAPRDEFALTNVSCDVRIGAAGALTANIPIARGDYAAGARIAAVKSSGGSAVYVYRNGAPWWPGLLWTKNKTVDDQGKPAVQIGAGTFESYLARVQLGADLPAMTGADQMDIARSLLADMQADPHSDLGITADTTMSAILRDRVMYLAAARPTYLQMLSDLATQDGGFEYLIQVLADPTTGARTRNLRLGYPRITTPVVHRISAPGAILSYSFPEDGSRGATYLMATGSGVQSTIHTDTAALAAGYPRLDMTTSYSNITDPAVLETHAAADLVQARVPVSVPSIVIRPDAAPDITPSALGDYVHVAITDELFPGGFAGVFRLVGMTVNPPERGKAETAALILN